MAVTIRDVAKAAGTSVATVSKVMNGSYAISDETAARVRAVMEELHYHPNVRAKNLARQSNRSVLYLTTLEKNTAFLNPHSFEIVSGIEHTLSEKEYLLSLKSTTMSDAPAYIEEMYDTKQADGFLIHASVISETLDALIDERDIPHLVIGKPGFESRFCWIDIDNTYAGSLAAKYLLTRGYRTVSYIGGSEEDLISAHRLDGVRSVLAEHDVILPKPYVKMGASDVESGRLMTEELLSEAEHPDAVICANNYLAYGCVRALREHHVSIPDEIGVMTFDEYPFSKLSKPVLSVVNIDVYDLGIEAGKKVLQKIKRPGTHIQSEITYLDVIAGETTR